MKKRILSLFMTLAIALSMTAPLQQVYAADSTISGIGTEGNNLSGGSGSGSWSKNKSGYRIYIVDLKTGQRVSNVVDFVFSTPPTSSVLKVYDTKVDYINGTHVSDSEHEVVLINSMTVSFDEAWPVPVYNSNGTYVAQGLEVKQWFLNGEGGITSGGSTSYSGATYTYSSTTPSGSISGTDKENEDTQDANSSTTTNSISDSKLQSLIQNLSTIGTTTFKKNQSTGYTKNYCYNTAKSAINTEYTAILNNYSLSTIQEKKLSDARTEAQNTLIELYNSSDNSDFGNKTGSTDTNTGTSTNNSKFQDALNELATIGGKKFVLYQGIGYTKYYCYKLALADLNEKYNAILSEVTLSSDQKLLLSQTRSLAVDELTEMYNSANNDDFGTKTLSISSIFNMFEDSIAYAADSEDATLTDNGNLPYVIDYKINGDFIFGFNNGVSIRTSTTFGGPSIVETCCAEGYNILVEPLWWFTPAKYSSGPYDPYPYMFYGTPTNYGQWQVAMAAAGLWTDGGKGGNYNRAINTAGANSLYIDSDFVTGAYTISVPSKLNQNLKNSEMAVPTQGYALHYYTCDGGSLLPAITTNDPAYNNPLDPEHPAPDPSPENIPLTAGEPTEPGDPITPDNPDPENEGYLNTTRTVNIVKTYQQIDVNGNITHVETEVRENCPGTIYINHEEDYKVVEYFSSKEYYDDLTIKYAPLSSETIWEEFEEYVTVSSIHETFDIEDVKDKEYGENQAVIYLGVAACEPGEVPKDQNSPYYDNTLYVRLVRVSDVPETQTGDPTNSTPHPAPDPDNIPIEPGEIIEDTRRITIIKYYENITEKSNGSITTEYLGPYVRESNPYIIDIIDEPEYTVDSWFITTTDYEGKTPASKYSSIASTESGNTLRKGSDPEKVTLESLENTLVVKLVKKTKEQAVAGDIIITESQITKAIETIDESISNWGPRIATWGYTSLKGCRGHSCSNPFCTTTHKCSFTISDATYNLNLINIAELNTKIQADVGSFAIKYIQGTGAIGNRTSLTAGNTSVTGDNMKSVLWRGEDIPTLTSYKETSSNTLLSLIGSKSIGNTPKTTRTTKTTLNYNLLIELDKNSGKGDYTTTSTGSRGCSNTSTHNLNDSLIYKASVVVQSYSGKAKAIGNATVKNKLYVQTFFTGKTIYPKESEGFMFQTTNHIKWYPYVRMTYQVTGQADPSRTNVNVLSQYISDILPNYYVESSWISTATDNNLNVKSAQWSLHAKATTGSEKWQGTNQVLPGGALYQLDTTGSKTYVNVVTWQPYLEDNILNNVVISGKDYTLDNTTKAHNNFAEQAEEALENWRVIQYVEKDYNKDNALGGLNVSGDGTGNVALTELGLTGKTSTDSKYLLTQNTTAEGIHEADIDVLSKVTVATYYKIKADINGEITISTSSDGNTWKIVETLAKDQNQDDIQSTAIKALEMRTKIVENLCTALNRNQGNDDSATWVSDGKWYNEAIDGICVVRYETCFEVGFAKPSSRTAVLDPNLCPVTASKQNNFTTAFMSQFATADKSDKYPDKVSGFIGQFMEHDVVLANHSLLFTSNIFYIPNGTVQDLAY